MRIVCGICAQVETEQSVSTVFLRQLLLVLCVLDGIFSRSVG